MNHRVISLKQSRDFARLSGDSNPLHVEPIWARRLQFGGCVVHGVNLTLLMLEEVLRAHRIPAGMQLAELAAHFDSALRVDEPFYIVIESDDPTKIKATALSGGRMVQRLFLRLGKSTTPEILIGERNPPALPCQETAFESLSSASGQVSLTFDSALARDFFPMVIDSLPRAQIAVLLASTMIVGMRLPGLHSVFACLNLNFVDSSQSADLRYRVVKADSRFNLVVISLDGGGAVGSLSALVRPQPVQQMDYISLQARVSHRFFTGRRVLVVGGSRGIGEATAKIVAAAGGNVTITYSAGRDDAARVAGEIIAGGGQCSEAHLDVRAELGGQLRQVLCDGSTDDIFYFASPVIDVSRSPTWRPHLFQQYVDYYVTSFSALVDQIISTRPDRALGLGVFYPSTVFLERPPAGSFEYCAAKSAGEMVCRGLEVSRSGISVVYPRLPRLLTDQTAALRTLVPQTPSEYMLSALASWRSVSE
jgi:NAD(P)-dependent dehydrogenase (short-subunit alcohol dehydrogenase family)